ncbi:long-chain fatty acid transport protein 4-like [Anneissia japonica]|uniref:long-chain fatty acid transport protein 4-like n=1 Tax=Anneissia japonica TaxID=1529436 RepID=UPI001425B407|nr:long-chain fatty acid transport protein 4-like [Anneissia japonica]
MAAKGLVFLALGVVLWGFAGLSFGLSLLSVFLIYLITGGWRFTRNAIITLPRDAHGIYTLFAMKYMLYKYQRDSMLVHKLFQRNVKKHPNKIAFKIEDKTWTFQQIEDYSNSVANYFSGAGYRHGDTVAIFMVGRPEFVAIWLGLSKIGVVAALINFNLRLKSMSHCVSVSNARAMIYGSELSEAISEAQGLQTQGLQYFCFGDVQPGVKDAIHLDPLIQSASTYCPTCPRELKMKDKLTYIYTSGTTGLPKAAVITHSRFIYMATGMNLGFNFRRDDIIYCAMPLYHSAGGIVGVGQVLLYGCSMAIRKKFSASRFWDDCIKYNATVIQYIGEICRYLLNQPDRPSDTGHKVRMAIGNGLQRKLWTDFVYRFKIPKIAEFYGATEGNTNIINTTSYPGAVGFNSIILPRVYPVTLIRVDEVTKEIIRNKEGLCERCKPGQVGHLIGKIRKGDPTREFHGYVNKEASGKKIACDVFQKGDSVFLSGDMLYMDELGYMFFCDRSGDTFRWKGENVSTTEVEGTVTGLLGLRDSACYGVDIPGTEGRAGMVAVVGSAGDIDLVSLNQGLQKALPAYAKPIFIRFTDKLDMTSTHKVKKTALREEAYHLPKVNGDAVYYLDGKTKNYEHLTDDIYQDILQGKIRF